MMYPVKKMYLTEKKKLEEEGYAVFSQDFFVEALLNFLSQLGLLYRVIKQDGNRKEVMQAYVAGFKGILGVGVALQAKEDISQPNIEHHDKKLETIYFDVYEKALDLKYTLKDHTFYSLFASYLGLGAVLGFNFDDITYVYENEK